MEREMGCPICKKKVLFVGVHDDEGNYHGLVGCEYENNPWSGLSYALHHEGWGECPLCTDGEYGPMGGMLFDTAEEAISALSPPNEPLSIEQLREMSYTDWVWAVFPELPPEENGWIRASQIYRRYPHESYGKTWIAYRHPKEEQ